jgi:hypothetical protein
VFDDTGLVGVVQAGLEVAEIEDGSGVVDDVGGGVVGELCVFVHDVGVELGRQADGEEMLVILGVWTDVTRSE